MSMTDPIADLLTRIRNAQTAKHKALRVPKSKMKESIVKILRDEGYIQGYSVEDDDRQGIINVELKYGPGGQHTITGLERVSKPGRRVYCGKDEIPRVLGGLGVTILSTSRGVMTGQACRQSGIGGEVLVNIW
ncbi:30S ribosomal protein S8 [Acidobacteria bacterium Mor1]|nr:30S ribosomal protein S8 [Acidobacteria bacterium Mor1]